MTPDLLANVDKWMESEDDHGFTVMFVKTGRNKRMCIMRSTTVTIGKVGEADTCADALAIALGRKPQTIPNRPAKEMKLALSLPGVPIVTRPGLPGTTRSAMKLPGVR